MSDSIHSKFAAPTSYSIAVMPITVILFQLQTLLRGSELKSSLLLEFTSSRKSTICGVQYRFASQVMSSLRNSGAVYQKLSVIFQDSGGVPLRSTGTHTDYPTTRQSARDMQVLRGHIKLRLNHLRAHQHGCAGTRIDLADLGLLPTEGDVAEKLLMKSMMVGIRLAILLTKVSQLRTKTMKQGDTKLTRPDSISCHSINRSKFYLVSESAIQVK